MELDLNEYKSALAQLSNANAQVRSLQDKFSRDKYEFEEVFLCVENYS